ncbi:MAG: VWA domain-containing protein [Planctomycetota bacterium]
MGAPPSDPLTLLRDALAELPAVQFELPQRLWLAIPAVAILALMPLLRRRGGMRPVRLGLLRAAILGCLVAVLCGPFYIERGEQTGAVFVLADTSPSVGVRGLEQMREALPADTEARLITFGAEAKSIASRDEIAADPRPVTDIAEALRLAAVRAGTTRPLRFVVLSDGRANRGDANEAARRLRRRRVEVQAIGVPDRVPQSAASFRVLRLRASEVEEPGKVPDLVALVEAEAEARAEATVYVDGKEVATQPIVLQAGRNEVQVPALPLGPGEYAVQLLLRGDRSPDDNLADTMLRVAGAPKVLVLAAQKRRSLVAEALESQGMEVTVAGADAKLDGYDAVVLLPDADARALDAGALASFIGERGGGLLAVGGSEGPGLARLADSPAAFLLPVEVEARQASEDKPTPPDKNEDPQPKIEIKEEKTQAYPISLCLLVDRSGSMIGEKIQRAKMAAAASADALTRDDRISVIAFGDTAEVIMAPRQAGNAQEVYGRVARLQARGRTAMFAALQLAYRVLDKEPTPIRHIVLLSDGEPTDNGRWRDLVTAGTAEKITLSCVGIGFDTNRRLMGNLVRWGRGVLWDVSHAAEIPQVVTQDTLRVVRARDERGRDAERNAPKKEEPQKEREPEKEPEQEPKPEPPTDDNTPPPGAPILVSRAAPPGMFKGIEPETLPEVAGIEESKPRFASWSAARGGDEGPSLLAYRRIGLGTSAALMTDPEARGGRTLREHPEFSRMMGQLLRSVLPDRANAAVQMTVRLGDGGRRVLLQVYGEDGRPRTDLPLRLELDGEPVPTLRRSDRYEAQSLEREAVVAARVRIGTEARPLLTRDFVLPPSRDPELGEIGIDGDALLRLVEGPEHLDVPLAAALVPPVATTARTRPLWLPFLALAAMLLPLDAWARRRAKSVSPSRRATRSG